MPQLKTTVKEMVEAARQKVEEIPFEQAVSMLDDPNVVIVDIRDIRERQRDGFIPGSLHMPRGMAEFWIDPNSPYYKDIFGDDSKKFVLHCASGWRSSLTVATLNEMGFPAAHIKEGFGHWKKNGGPVEYTDTKKA